MWNVYTYISLPIYFLFKSSVIFIIWLLYFIFLLQFSLRSESLLEIAILDFWVGDERWS